MAHSARANMNGSRSALQEGGWLGYALVIVFQAVAVLALIALQQLFPLGERSII